VLPLTRKEKKEKPSPSKRKKKKRGGKEIVVSIYPSCKGGKKKRSGPFFTTKVRKERREKK